MKQQPIRLSQRSLLGLGTMVVLMAFAACTPGVSEPPVVTSTPSTPSTPTPTPTPHDPSTPDASCDTLFPLEALYAYNPNLAPQPNYQPQPGTPFHTAVTLGGTSCAWVNETGTSTLEVAVAHPPANELDKLKANAPGKNVNYGPTAVYFTRHNNKGEIQAFTSAGWLVAQSDMFFSETDAAALLALAQAALGT